MSTSDPNRHPNSTENVNNKLKSIKKMLETFGKRKGRENDEEIKVPKATQWRTSARNVTTLERLTAPDLGDDGWGERSWQKVRPNHKQQVEIQDHLFEPSRRSGNGANTSSQRFSAQTQSTSTRALYDFGNRASLSPSPSPSPSPHTLQTPHNQSTPPRGSISASASYTPQHTPPATRTHTTPSRRTPSVSSGASSQTQNMSTHRTPLGSSFTSQGVNVRALPKRRTASSGGSDYTKQGIRVAGDGYVGKWKDPKKKGEGEVWKGHPALQPRPA